MERDDNNNSKNNPLTIRVSRRFLILSFVASCLAAYATGHIARIFLILNPQEEFLRAYQDQLSKSKLTQDDAFTLPDPVLQIGKTPPLTTYTSKNFNTAKSSTTHSRWMVMETAAAAAADADVEKETVDSSSNSDINSDQQPRCRSSTNETCDSEFELIPEEEHLPAGQHLLIDIEHVDSAFLNSEERLATAMLDLVNECGLTLLSYHCHSLLPSGVSCAGVLLESHVSFHTWPTEGVITLDLFTCGPNSLLPIVPLAERLFAVPSVEATNESEYPKVIWAHKYRGFGREFEHDVTDMFRFPIGQINVHKQEVRGWVVQYCWLLLDLILCASFFFENWLSLRVF